MYKKNRQNIIKTKEQWLFNYLLQDDLDYFTDQPIGTLENVKIDS